MWVASVSRWFRFGVQFWCEACRGVLLGTGCRAMPQCVVGCDVRRRFICQCAKRWTVAVSTHLHAG